ncbi:vWA domain-containing protein [Methylolobus aquaticus]
MTNVGFAMPWLLLAALSALIPWLASGQRPLHYSSLTVAPTDRVSTLIDRAVKLSASLGLIALVVAVAGPYRREQTVERLGFGAEIVLLIDRSSSMNESFVGRYLGGAARETKGAVAREILTDFVTRRKDDLFAVVAFSAAPIYVLPLTQDRGAVSAAVRSSTERGHGITNIGSGLAMALDFFEGRRNGGARIILLVSDGAARIEEETRERLHQAFSDTDARLYWIYLRNRTGVHLDAPPENPGESTTPEYFLHQFFQTLGSPYRAYEAENADALRRAVADIEALENDPLPYLEKIPRQDLATYGYVAALVFLLPLLASRALEVDRWRF